MRKIDITDISNEAQMTFPSGVLSHMDLQVLETANGMCQAIVGSLGYDPTKAYVLFGCVNTGIGSNYVISAGAIFFNGEIYTVPAATFTISGPNVAVATIGSIPYTGGGTNADPVLFTDGNTHDVLDIFQITISAGLSGSGNANYTDFIFVSLVQTSQVLTKGGTTAFTPVLGTDPVNKAYADSLVPSGVKAVLNGITTIGTLVSGGSKFTIPLGATLASNVYYVVPVTLTSTPTVNPGGISCTITNQTTVSFDVWIYPAATVPSNILLSWIIFQ